MSEIFTREAMKLGYTLSEIETLYTFAVNAIRGLELYESNGYTRKHLSLTPEESLRLAYLYAKFGLKLKPYLDPTECETVSKYLVVSL